jgi:hypothetical protein
LELLAKPSAFGQIHHHRLREERDGWRIRGPLELFVAAVHVLDQVFHPKQRFVTIPHGAVLRVEIGERDGMERSNGRTVPNTVKSRSVESIAVAKL